MPLQIAVLIMAAGASTRMKGIKQLMPWKDSNFLLETIKTVQQCNVLNITIVLGSNAELISNQCHLNDLDVHVITNADWAEGLGNSIAHAVKVKLQQQETYDGILICLADQPLLTHEYLNKVINEFEKHPEKIIGTNYGKRVGVPALFPKIFFSELSKLKGDSGAKLFLNEQSESIISLQANKQIIDIDTNAEYEQLMAHTNKTKI